MITQYTGVIKSIPFFDQQTGYGIFKTNESLTVLGVARNARIGKRLTATGEITIHRIYGKQLKAIHLTVENPNDVNGLKHMIASAKIPGVGVAAAKKLADYFGTDVLQRLNDAEALKAAGMKPDQIDALIEYYDKHSRNAELLELLGRAGLGPKTINSIIQSKLDIDNPFNMLGKIPRLSFADVDKIWMVLNGDNNSDVRIPAGINEALRRTQKLGNSGIPSDRLVSDATTLLSAPNERVTNVLNARLGADLIEFPSNSGIVYNSAIYKIERYIAQRLKNIHTKAPKLEHKTDVTLTHEQMAGVECAMRNAQCNMGCPLLPVRPAQVKLH